jgi:hypothetical protein
MMRVPHPVYLPDLSPSDFLFSVSPKERRKSQIIMSEDDLEDQLTEVWETVSGPP